MHNIETPHLHRPPRPRAKKAIVVAKGNTFGMKVVNAVNEQHVKSRPT
jgi:hypothetical protein